MLRKRIFSLLISLAMVVTMIPMMAAPAFASTALKKYDDFTIGNLSYTVINTSSGYQDSVGKVAVRKADNLKASEITGTVVIPETVVYNGDRYLVTEIQEYAFKDCRNLKSVVLAGTQQSFSSGVCKVFIKDGAFWNCSGLNNFTTFLKEIEFSYDYNGVGAFEGVGTKAHRCYLNASKIFLLKGDQGKQKEYINMIERSFEAPQTTNATNFEWSEWDKDRGRGQGGYFITRYVSPLTKSYDEETNCNVNTLVIPNQIKSTDPETYTLVYYGSNVNKDGNNYTIKQPDLEIASKITDVVISEGIERIGPMPEEKYESKFGEKYGIDEIVLPSSMKALKEFAFANFNIRSITFNKGIETVGAGILAGCETLEKVTFKSTPSLDMSESAFVDMNTKKKPTLVLPSDWFGPNYTIDSDCWCGGRFNLYLNPAKCPKLTVKKYGKRSFKLSWKKILGANYYVVQTAKKGKTLKTAVKTTKRTYTVKKVAGKSLKKGTKYRMRVLAYNKYGTLIGKSAIVTKKR